MPMRTKAEQRAYQVEWLRARREAWLKAHGPCVRCGSRRDLHVDHIDPSTKVGHKVWSWSAERRERELAKCQVLCRKCHENKTAREQRTPLVHGTLAGYKRKRCRCADCRAANAAYESRRKVGRAPETVTPTVAVRAA